MMGDNNKRRESSTENPETEPKKFQFEQKSIVAILGAVFVIMAAVIAMLALPSSNNRNVIMIFMFLVAVVVIVWALLDSFLVWRGKTKKTDFVRFITVAAMIFIILGLMLGVLLTALNEPPQIQKTLRGHYTDVDASIAYWNEIENLRDSGVMKGIAGNEVNFSPAENLSRGDFAVLLSNLGGVDISTHYEKGYFSDTDLQDNSAPYYATFITHCMYYNVFKLSGEIDYYLTVNDEEFKQLKSVSYKELLDTLTEFVPNLHDPKGIFNEKSDNAVPRNHVAYLVWNNIAELRSALASRFRRAPAVPVPTKNFFNLKYYQATPIRSPDGDSEYLYFELTTPISVNTEKVTITVEFDNENMRNNQTKIQLLNKSGEVFHELGSPSSHWEFYLDSIDKEITHIKINADGIKNIEFDIP